MTNPDSAGREQPQTVIGPITLGQNGGGDAVVQTFDPGTTLTPVELGLHAPVELTALVPAPDALTLRIVSAHGSTTITIQGVNPAGIGSALPANAKLTSIVRNPNAVIVHCAGGQIHVPLGTGPVTVSVAAVI